MVFRLYGRLRANEIFFYKGNELEKINGFQYIGLLFTPTLYMYKMTEDFSKKAKKYYCLLHDVQHMFLYLFILQHAES